MKVMTVKEISTLEDGAAVPAIKGVLTKIEKRKVGKTDIGEWSYENAVLQDSTGEIKVTFKNREALPADIADKQVHLLSHQGDRGWTGINAKDDEYRGSVKRVLIVGKNAEVVESAVLLSRGESTPEPGPLPAAKPEPAATAASPSGNITPAQANALKEARLFIARRLVGQKLTLKACLALRADWQEVTKEEMPTELFQSINSTLFISADRAGLFDAMPTNIDFKAKPEAACVPPPAANPPAPKAGPTPTVVLTSKIVTVPEQF